MKKFNKYIIIRIICIFAAIITVGCSVLSVYSLSDKCTHLTSASFKDYTRSVLHNEATINVPSSKNFELSYFNYLGNLYNYIPTGDGSKDAYKEYCTTYNKSVDKMTEFIAKELGIPSKTGSIDMVSLYNLLEDNGAKLIPLGKHEHSIFADGDGKKMNCYQIHWDDNTMCYLADNGVIYNEYGEAIQVGEIFNDGDYYNFISYELYEDDDDVEETTMLSSNSTVIKAAENNTTYSNVTLISSYKTIPEKLVKKAGDSTIVQLCNFYYENQIYDGFYKIEFTPLYIANHYDTQRFFASEKYDSYSDFKVAHDDCERYIKDYPNFHYIVTDGKGKKISGDADSVEKIKGYEWYVVRTTTEGITEASDLYNSSYYDFDDLKSLLKSDEDCVIAIAFDMNMPADCPVKAVADDYVQFYASARAVIRVLCVSGLIFVLAIVVLMIFAGRKSYEDGVHMHKTDKVPSLLRIAFDWALMFGIAYGVAVFDSSWFSTFSLSPTPVTFFGVVGFALVACDMMTFTARHIKNRTFLKNTVAGRIITAVARDIRKRRESGEAFENAYKYLGKRVVAFAVPEMILIVSVLFLGAADFWAAAFICAFFAAALLIATVVYILKYMTGVKVILSATREIKNGNYDIQLNINNFMKPLQQYAQHVNEITVGLKNAVDQAVMEQNTKTELITNISHDLKTPLTSVINYVDLLKETDITDEKALEYLETLNEKSSRLKRLIEDLVEASKATTGNIDVDLTQMSFIELVRQITGEYEDEMSAAGLELITDIPNEEIQINADSRMVYRVMDNLMNNARKYSMKGTRVYASVVYGQGKVSFVLKNISSAPLNISAEELKQRFVRGDISRTTDGSGLGLSIAENFCELMGAKLKLKISGDMFEASVMFDRVEKEA